MVAIRKKVGARGFMRSKPLAQGKKIFKIDCSTPAADEIMDKETLTGFEQYFQAKVKLHGQKGKLGDKVKINLVGDSLNISTTMQYRKKYFKYLTKKYLKKKGFCDILRVLAKGKEGYAIQYFKIGDEAME